MRTLVIMFVIGLCLGAVGGTVVAKTQLSKSVNDAAAQQVEQQAKLEAAQREVAELRTRIEELDQTQKRLEAMNASRPKRPREVRPEPLAEVMPPEASLGAEGSAEAYAAPPAGSERESRPPRPGGDEPAAQGEMEARGRGEMMSRIQERIGNFLQSEADQSDDPAQRERYLNLSELMTANAELRRQMREASTDEQREELQAAMGQNWDSIRSLSSEIQKAKIQSVADRYNIPEAQRTQFMDDVNRASASPLFGPGPAGPGFFGFERGGRGQGAGQ